jgi:hypothetical protein
MADPVADEERLFRRIRNESTEYKVASDGSLLLSSTAFQDRNCRPSVDRETLCPSSPPAAWTQEEACHGVVWLLARGVRALKPIGERIVPGQPKESVSHAIDVYPDAILATETVRANPAHAEIRPTPEWVTKSAFRRFLEHLSQLAQWEIRPEAQRRDAHDDASTPSPGLGNSG